MYQVLIVDDEEIVCRGMAHVRQNLKKRQDFRL